MQGGLTATSGLPFNVHLQGKVSYISIVQSLTLCRLYIFGGNDIRIGAMNNLWCFDMAMIGDLEELAQNKSLSADYPLEWKQLATRGSVPSPITHHKTVVAGKNMYLIGGVMTGRDYTQNQMYRLDLQSLNWDIVGTRG